MPDATRRPAAANDLYLLLLTAIVALALLSFLMFFRRAGWTGGRPADRLFLFSAAGLRGPVERIVDDYRRRYGIEVQVQYGASNTLLSQLEIAPAGDLYLAADEAYLRQARQKGLTAEVLPIACMCPVLVVRKGNVKQIVGIEDLLRPDVRVSLANPDAAAIGRAARELLEKSGQWERLASQVTRTGVFKPTVTDVANDVKLGSVDAGIVWDATAAQYPEELAAIPAPELSAGKASVEVAVLRSARHPTAALRFARFLSARDAGLEVFRQLGFEVVEGDVWEESPELTFFAGSVNRRALEPIVAEFARREGVTVTTVYNGCGVLTAQMRAIRKKGGSGFPDVYMACDVYYLETVKDWFQEGVHVSDTEIVIAVQRGNPKSIRELKDLARPGIRLAIGQPEQCTIGVLTRNLLEQEGLYQVLLQGNVVTQTATSALLVPSVTTGAADASLAYATDTLAERHRVDVVRIDSPLAKAIQPFSIARSSNRKHLARRLLERIARSRGAFEAAGFHFRIPPGVPEAAAGKQVSRP